MHGTSTKSELLRLLLEFFCPETVCSQWSYAIPSLAPHQPLARTWELLHLEQDGGLQKKNAFSMASSVCKNNPLQGSRSCTFDNERCQNWSTSSWKLSEKEKYKETLSKQNTVTVAWHTDLFSILCQNNTLTSMASDLSGRMRKHESRGCDYFMQTCI